MTPRRGRTRRRRSGPPRCRHCDAVIRVFGSPFRAGAWMTFEATPVDQREVPKSDAFPIYHRQAYRPDDLAAMLQGLTNCTVEEAADQVHAVPWHRRHLCIVLAKITGADPDRPASTDAGEGDR